MRARIIRRTGAVAAVAIAGAAGIATTGVAAGPGGNNHGGKPATITMELNGKNLEFAGDRKVATGSKLQIVNRTAATKVGPHTFQLVKRNLVPKTRKQIKDCEKLQSTVCQDVFKALKVDPKTHQVKKPVVDVGKKGWDKSFGKRGDAWFAGAQGATESRRVKAKPGTVLHYFCLIHPFMHGTIKVVKK